MEFNILKAGNQSIAEVVGNGIVVNNVRDALDMIGNASYYEAIGTILWERQLNPAFFDLRTGLAGEILQKYANYKMKLAIIGEFSKFESNSLNAFIIESNRGTLAFFVSDLDTAIAKLTST